MKHHLACLVLIAAIVAGCANARQGEAQPGARAATPPSGGQSATPATSTSLFAGTHYASQGHTHLVPDEPDDFVYNSNPPTSGPHRELFTDAFINAKPLPSYIQVHLLEHGNVLLQYNCNCPDVGAALKQIALQYDKPFMSPGEAQPTAAEVQNAQDQGKAVIVAPYPHMKSKIALTAWTRLGTLQSVDKEKIDSFIAAHLANPTE